MILNCIFETFCTQFLKFDPFMLETGNISANAYRRTNDKRWHYWMGMNRRDYFNIFSASLRASSIFFWRPSAKERLT